MLHDIFHEIFHALLDTLYIVPVLFLVYLIIEFVSHGNSFETKLIKSKKFGPIIGGSLGIFPQCGFSSAMSDLYSKRTITIGTLFAVFIATSDEAIVILLAHPHFIINLLILIGIKLASAIIIGYSIDLILGSYKIKPHESSLHQNHDCHNHCECHILKDTIKQTLQVSLFIFIATAIINIILFFFPIESLTLTSKPILQTLITPLIGLIPNCASSVFLVELYINGLLGFGPLIAGLSAGSGVGILVLFRKNKNIKENLLILASLYCFGVLIGLVVNLFVL